MARSRRRPGSTARADRSDPVRLDVFHHLFSAAAEEMGATLLRSSFSPNIRERRDFSCALFDGEARMIGQASHLPIHLGSTPMSVEAALEAVDPGPGDAVILNDPYAGGTHLPDITLVSPVFLPGSRRADFFCANRAHHADVGGAEPGSMAPARDVHGEGLRIPPVRLVRNGVVDRELLALLLANMRVPREREGDLLAQWSTNRVGEQRLLALAAEHGATELRVRSQQLMDWTERLTRELLSALPNRRWDFEDELDEEAPSGARGRAKIRLTMEVRGDRLRCDFTDTDAVPDSSLNATRAVTVSAVFYVLRALLPTFTPTNDGILRPITIETRPGTLVDASYPSGVAAGNVETSQRIVDVLLGAFARILPGRLPAASAGTMSNLTFGGSLGARSDEPYAYYETIGGGAGASADGPGAHGLQTHMTNTRNTPIEALEATYPVRVMGYGVRRGSGGRGRFAGGDGIRRVLRFLRPTHVSFVGERQSSGPWGLAGGGEGARGAAYIRVPGAEDGGRRGRRRVLGGRAAVSVEAGCEVEVLTPGGGGYGATDSSRGKR